MRATLILIATTFWLLILVLYGAAPKSQVLDMGEWYKSLRSPTTGISCCDISDCAPTSAHLIDGRWVALTTWGQWVAIPEETILTNTPNPTGQPVLCYQPGRGVLCFVQPPGA